MSGIEKCATCDEAKLLIEKLRRRVETLEIYAGLAHDQSDIEGQLAAELTELIMAAKAVVGPLAPDCWPGCGCSLRRLERALAALEKNHERREEFVAIIERLKGEKTKEDAKALSEFIRAGKRLRCEYNVYLCGSEELREAAVRFDAALAAMEKGDGGA